MAKFVISVYVIPIYWCCSRHVPYETRLRCFKFLKPSSRILSAGIMFLHRVIILELIVTTLLSRLSFAINNCNARSSRLFCIHFHGTITAAWNQKEYILHCRFLGPWGLLSTSLTYIIVIPLYSNWSSEFSSYIWPSLPWPLFPRWISFCLSIPPFLLLMVFVSISLLYLLRNCKWEFVFCSSL